MQIKNRIILFVLVLFSGNTGYCQNTKEKPAVVQQVFFGNFLADTPIESSIPAILKADSLFMNAVNGVVPGKIVAFDVYTTQGRIGIAETAEGNRLSKKQKILISNLQSGANLAIQKITVKYPGKNRVILNSKFIFKLKK